MKRSEHLSGLSREHHRALIMAKRACRTSPDAHAEAVDLVTRLGDFFRLELEPHFRVEEESLLPALRRAGRGEIADRTIADHEALRAAVRRIEAGDIDRLRYFGELLAAHVRFEERDLFPVAESVLSPETLAFVGRPQGHCDAEP